ncbi:phosphatase PAP2 family protein [Celeribacter indicus]|uniref:PA-phosphatase-like phosphoesterase n=1 Tax=Celeribacter indicus TaxID=1208324 RepID=A0A0B5DXK5_9RHOB|nr:phosphatase PAP2 family protein [Celeribacter indicus]AJE47719.1 PA-phosphatase-like phosphoesterase [Celeribacter indicus]SDW15134.1 undecaprenyl-diphosphatase [Celeribacter indicus]
MPLPAPIANLGRRIELVPLLVLLLTGGALWAFFGLAAEMIEGDLHAFDERLLLTLRNPDDPGDPIGGRRLAVAMRDLTALGGVTVLTVISLSVLIYLLLDGRRASALFLAVAILGGQALSHLTKLGFSRPRPDLVPHGVEVATASFPSGHSLMATVTYLTLAVMLSRSTPKRRIRAFFILTAALIAVLVGASRVFLGVHWPSDVLAGWSLGAAWALGVWLVARWLGRRGRIEADTASDA